MNPVLIQKALEKVGNINTLINLVSRRVRQFNAGGGSTRPLVADTSNLGVADIALREIIEEKLGWEPPEPTEPTRPVRRKPSRIKPATKAPRADAPQIIDAAAT